MYFMNAYTHRISKVMVQTLEVDRTHLDKHELLYNVISEFKRRRASGHFLTVNKVLFT